MALLCSVTRSRALLLHLLNVHASVPLLFSSPTFSSTLPCPSFRHWKRTLASSSGAASTKLEGTFLVAGGVTVELSRSRRVFFISTVSLQRLYCNSFTAMVLIHLCATLTGEPTRLGSRGAMPAAKSAPYASPPTTYVVSMLKAGRHIGTRNRTFSSNRPTH